MARRQRDDVAHETAPERWMRSVRLSGFTLTILALVIMAGVVLAPSLKLLVEQQQQLAQLKSGVSKQQQAVRNLEGEVARWNDPAYIEAQARDRLLYVYPGEYSYLVIDDGSTQKTSDGAPISSHIQTTRVDWVKSLLSSVLAAGLSNQSANNLTGPTK
ncbi:MAG: septum formation initiator family protein [Glaciihabitans sp.]|jgi:cell division protein FtsB|nr:septum formation initiator family protein [Glaciihabitans sp.]MCU1534807.1 septum formation initiator family protein [Glaciihabitans sp.]